MDKLFLETLLQLLDQSKKAYLQYINDGKTYRHALLLKKYNDKVLTLLGGEDTETSHPFYMEISALISHYREWSAKWEALDLSKKFEPGDVFVFENDVTFPRQAAGKLEAYYLTLSDQE